MTKDQKKQLSGLVDEIETIVGSIEEIAGEEREKFDAMSEKAQEGERGEQICRDADSLEEISGEISDLGVRLKELAGDE